VVRLQPNGNPVVVEGVQISTPGLQGNVEVFRPGRSDVRGRTTWSQPFADALDAQNVRTELVLDMADTQETPSLAPAGSRNTTYGEPAIVIDAPNPGEDWGQVVLYTDESGVTTWNYPLTSRNELDTTRAGTRSTFVIPRRVVRPTSDQPDDSRGIAGSLAKKVLSLVIFPILDPLFGKVGEVFAGKWERERRPYGFRTWTPANWQQGAGDSVDWASIDGRKSLLLVHGTFSRTQPCFGAFPSEGVERLHDIYEGRLLAFDHFTLSEDPDQNVEWFMRNLPDGVHLELDVICHSRGGLVSRVLAEQSDRFETGADGINVRRVVFVATPNSGTVLADPQHMKEWLDAYTNILNYFPPNGVTDAIETVVTVVKHAAIGALEGLKGLQSMRPSGDYLKTLNRPTSQKPEYFAMTADYEPIEAGWSQMLKDRAMDSIFGGQNDLVVPTAGVFSKNGSNLFPIAKTLEFGDREGVYHSGFWGNQMAQDQLLEWLGG